MSSEFIFKRFDSHSSNRFDQPMDSLEMVLAHRDRLRSLLLFSSRNSSFDSIRLCVAAFLDSCADDYCVACGILLAQTDGAIDLARRKLYRKHVQLDRHRRTAGRTTGFCCDFPCSTDVGLLRSGPHFRELPVAGFGKRAAELHELLCRSACVAQPQAADGVHPWMEPVEPDQGDFVSLARNCVRHPVYI